MSDCIVGLCNFVSCYVYFAEKLLLTVHFQSRGRSRSPNRDRRSPGRDRRSPGGRDRRSPGRDRRSPGRDRPSKENRIPGKSDDGKDSSASTHIKQEHADPSGITCLKCFLKFFEYLE